jgi:hypothetical protein
MTDLKKRRRLPQTAKRMTRGCVPRGYRSIMKTGRARTWPLHYRYGSWRSDHRVIGVTSTSPTVTSLAMLDRVRFGVECWAGARDRVEVDGDVGPSRGPPPPRP